MAHNFESRLFESCLARLTEMRQFGGDALTVGLTDEVIRDFIEDGYDDLPVAIDRGYEHFRKLQETHPEFLTLSEAEQVALTHEGLTNF